MNVIEHHESPALAPQLCRQLVERVCASSELRRSARLRDFLRYVADRALDGKGNAVSEQEIGIHVFGRQPDYDTAIDNIVRVNASELRKRVHNYFQGREGADEAIVFDIPRGSYVPQFSLRSGAIGHAVISAAETPLAHSSNVAHGQASAVGSRRGTWLGWSVAAAMTIVAALFALAWHESALRLQPWKQQPALRQFWSPLLESSRPTDLVLADTSVTIAQDMFGNTVTLPEYLNGSYTRRIERSSLPSNIQNELELLLSRSNSSFGDFQTAQRILNLAPGSPTLRLNYARDLRADAVKMSNLILIGSSYSNPWSSLLESRLNFKVGFDPTTHQMALLNAHPRPGELPEYNSVTDASGSTGFSIIAYFPASDGMGARLLLAGTTAEATEAAGEFVSSNTSLHNLTAKLKDPSGPFEAALRTRKLNGTPLSAELIAVRP